jgi:hypothetical protein
MSYIIIIILFIIYYVHFRQLYSSGYRAKGNQHLKYNKLMIVAHPDDELIFGGRFLLESRGWKVVCITNGTDKSEDKFRLNRYNRRNEFIRSMNILKCNYEIWDYEDNYFNSNHDTKLLNQLSDLLNDKEHDIIITHNADGEYGHIQHKTICDLVKSLKPNNLYEFDTNKNIINPQYDIIMKLKYIYPSQINVFDELDYYIRHQSLRYSEII